MFGGLGSPETPQDDPFFTVSSPTDSVTGLLDNNSNGDTEYTLGAGWGVGGRLSQLNQVVQNLRLPGTNNYSSLNSVPSLVPGSRPLLTRSVIGGSGSDIDILNTKHGRVVVNKAGNPTGPTLITFHDLGLNGVSNFQAFLSCPAMVPVMTKFRVLNISAPGQEGGAEDLASDRDYPSMEQLSEVVEFVCHNYGLPSVVGLGVGLGANVLVRLASRRPKLVDGLVLVNCNSQTSGWMEWAYNKVNIKQLKKVRTVPDSVVEFLIWHHLGRMSGLSSPNSRGLDVMSLASIYRQYFTTQVNPTNLAMLVQTYATRSDLHLARDQMANNGKPMLGQTSRTLKMPVLNIVGDHSPHVEATVTFNGRLDPTKCTWMKIGEAGMVLEEQPLKVAEAIRLFVQGLGYTLRPTRSQSVTHTPTKLSLPLQINGYDTPLVQLKVRNGNEDLKV